MIISKTPFRLSFFGGGTDYNSWFEKNPGLVVSTTFSKYCYISLRKLPPFFDHKTRVLYSKEEQVQSNHEIKHPAIRNALKFLSIDDGLEIHHDGDLPARSGIGSSSSFTVGMLNALYTYKGLQVDKRQLANDAIFVEQKLSCEHVGIQDQIIASFGGFQVLEMSPQKEYTVRSLQLPEDYKRSLEKHVLLGFTGLSRIASDNARTQIQNIENGQSYQKLKEVYDISREGLSLFENQASFEQVGKLLHQSWEVKRTLTDKISNELIEDLYASALRAGAYGGKLLGAGGGGFVMFLPHPKSMRKLSVRSLESRFGYPFNLKTRAHRLSLATRANPRGFSFVLSLF